jgi:hypothetical protein
MTDIYVNTGTTFQQPYNARQPAIGRVPANAQLPARQPANAQNPFTYQNRSPFTYRNPSSAQQPYIANAQQPYPYIANAQQPYIANSQTPFTYQNRQPVNGQQPYIANGQQPYIANARQPFTYQARYPANAQTPYIANARQPGTYQARNPFTYRVPYIANARQPYIANAQQPYIANGQNPFIYQATYQRQANYQVPFTYQVTYQAQGRTPAIGTQPGTSTVTVSDTINQSTTGTSLWVYDSTSYQFIISAYVDIWIKLTWATSTYLNLAAKFNTSGGYVNRSKPSWATWNAYYTMWYLSVTSTPNTFQLECDSSYEIDDLFGGGFAQAAITLSSNADTTFYIDGSTTNYTWPSSAGTYGYKLRCFGSQEEQGQPTIYYTLNHYFRMNKTGFPQYSGPSIDTDCRVLLTNSSTN